MDGIGILIFLGAITAYFLTKKYGQKNYTWLLFLAGFGLGIVAGLVYIYFRLLANPFIF